MCAHTHIRAHKYICMYVCMYIYIYIYIYIYVNIPKYRSSAYLNTLETSVSPEKQLTLSQSTKIIHTTNRNNSNKHILICTFRKIRKRHWKRREWGERDGSGRGAACAKRGRLRSCVRCYDCRLRGTRHASLQLRQTMLQRRSVQLSLFRY
jgi:hypothetical protein